jgi:uncharacterized protein YegJ (DUF2314 family)
MGQRWWVVVLLGILGSTSACQRKGGSEDFGAGKQLKPGASRRGRAGAPVGSLLGTAFRYRFVIYTSAPSKTAVAEVARLAKAAGFALAAEPGNRELPPVPTSIFWGQPEVSELPPPEPSSLEYFASGLSEAEKRALVTSRGVTALEVVGKAEHALTDYRKALSLTQELARKLGGVIWDDESRTAHSVQSFKRRLESWNGDVPDISRHVSIHQYRDGELLRLVTVGMVKLGLPDLVVNDVASNDAAAMANLVNLVAQSLLERQKLDAPGTLHASIDLLRHAGAKAWLASDLKSNAKRSVDLTLVVGELEEGDADNRLLEIAFPGPAERLQERQTAAIADLFGSEDGLVNVRHDAAILAASKRAREKAFKLRPRYEESVPFGEELQVKVPFTTTAGGNEWMWVEVITWRGNSIKGILNNDPYDVPTLKAGSRVEVRADQIFDYILRKRDGTMEGNETGPLLEAQAE